MRIRIFGSSSAQGIARGTRKKTKLSIYGTNNRERLKKIQYRKVIIWIQVLFPK
jgi:hypothetical protein